MPRPLANVVVPALVALALTISAQTAAAATSADVEAMIANGKAYLYAEQAADGTWELAPKRDESLDNGQDTKGSQWGGRTALVVATTPVTRTRRTPATGHRQTSTCRASSRCQVAPVGPSRTTRAPLVNSKAGRRISVAPGRGSCRQVNSSSGPPWAGSAAR